MADRGPAVGDPAPNVCSTTGTGQASCSLDMRGHLTRTTPQWGGWPQRTLIKQEMTKKQTSSNISKWYPHIFSFISVWIILISTLYFDPVVYCFNIARERFICLEFFSCISAQWKSQREEGARHTDRKAGEFWRWVRLPVMLQLLFQFTAKGKRREY